MLIYYYYEIPPLKTPWNKSYLKYLLCFYSAHPNQKLKSIVTNLFAHAFEEERPWAGKYGNLILGRFMGFFPIFFLLTKIFICLKD